MENIESVIYCADKYDLQLLRKKSMNFLQSKIKKENVFSILELATKWNLRETREICVNYLINNADQHLKSESFTHISREDVHAVLDSDQLKTSDEKNVYDAAMRWGEAECSRQNLCACDEHIRQVLGPVLYTIRFSLMKNGIFTTDIVDLNILSMSEKVEIYKYIDRQSEKDCVLFSCKPRSYLSKCYLYEKNYPHEAGPPHPGLPTKYDSCLFKLSRPASFLKAIMVYEATVGNVYKISLKKGEEIVCSFEEQIMENVSNEDRIRTIMLPENVHIPAKVVHTLEISVPNGDFHSHGSCAKSVVNYGPLETDRITLIVEDPTEVEDIDLDEFYRVDQEFSACIEIVCGFLLFSD